MIILDSDQWLALLRGRLDLRGRATPAEDLANTAARLATLTVVLPFVEAAERPA
jgi:hypothetical protein